MGVGTKFAFKNASETGLPDFSGYMKPKPEKYTKLPQCLPKWS
jgi:hypothetical protein